MTKVSFYGASGEVTGSNFVVDTGEKRYVVDCGLYQGLHSAEENEHPFEYDPKTIDAAIITHAHLDHIGRVPMLVKGGFSGPIYATAATVELAQLILKDALGVMQGHARDNNVEPMYDEADLHRALALFKPCRYHEKINLFGNDSVTFYDAGHILGSASVTLEAGGKKLVFSGDLGHYPNVLLPHLETPREADMIVMEATYGGVEHQESPNVTKDRLEIVREALQWTVQNRGVLLIPAFSLERTEEILYLMKELFMTKQLPKIPIYLDSPLAIETLEVFERHQELYSQAVQKEAQQSDVFDFRGLVLTPTVEDSKDINDQHPPKVIIAGSGMMEGGRIVHHLKRYLSLNNTMVLVIGYQAMGTLGQRIAGGEKVVHFAGTDVTVRAKIVKAEIFSGHADNGDLVEWVKSINFVNREKGRIVIVHSEKDRALNFQKELDTLMPDVDIEVAQHGETVEA